MSSLKKQGAGTYLTALTTIASVVGFAFYMVNCGTNYFKSQGTNPVVTACAVVAILAQILYLGLAQKNTIAADILPVASGVTLTVALANFVATRVNGIAAIMTFTNNAQNMKDLSSAIVAIAALAIAMILNMIAAFFAVTKD